MNVASKKTFERMMRCSELYRNIERQSEKNCPPNIGSTSNRLTYVVITREVDEVAPRKKPSLKTLENLKAA